MSNDRFNKNPDAQAIIQNRLDGLSGTPVQPPKTLEGGCGVIGIIGSEALPGRMIIRSCRQMQNRGNGKGGGVAAVGLFPEFPDHYALHVAFLDESVKGEVEKNFITPHFDIAKEERQPNIDDYKSVGLEVRPPTVYRYFVRVKKKTVQAFQKRISASSLAAAEDEFVFQNSFRLNDQFYVKPKQPRAFVLSHGRDLMILKAVGFAEQVAQYYCLEETGANIWIGHQRYPTRGRVWHPGGAHPFAGLNEALVHNGDFANYYAVTEYLRQRGMVPQFVTDTEVSVLLFDLYSRVLNYPLEYVIEALAPTPDGDFERLSKRRQRIYRAIQTAHLHGSPDGPWFFIVARVDPKTHCPQLIGITDVSMLRPQVFALQVGEKSFGAIASEKQAIDAFFEEVSEMDPTVPPVADRYWNARGGSCTDGGAFVYTLLEKGGKRQVQVKDKFGNEITAIENHVGKGKRANQKKLPRSFETGPARMEFSESVAKGRKKNGIGSEDEKPIYLNRDLEEGDRVGKLLWGELYQSKKLQQAAQKLQKLLAKGDFSAFENETESLVDSENFKGWRRALSVLTFLRDRRWNPKKTRRSHILAAIDKKINEMLDRLPGPLDPEDRGGGKMDYDSAWKTLLPPPITPDAKMVVDARGFPPEGPQSVSRLLVMAYERGWKNMIVYRCQGDRFIGCGLGSDTADVRIDVYGASGDYLGSGMDGATVMVHGDAQDQVGQILKAGTITIFGSVGQTFLYGAKGGRAFVMGSAAGRPLINAVGGIRAIINGTCLDYCAESFMAGHELDGGFVIINGLTFQENGDVIGLEIKYPGNNLFSLASGGACYLNDPYSTVSESQLNGASFERFKQADWNVILPMLKDNEAYFGISIRHDLLMVDGLQHWPKEVFRKVVKSRATGDLDWSSIPI